MLAVKWMNRLHAEQIPGDMGWVVVSINNSDQHDACINNGFDDVLFLTFDDAVEEDCDVQSVLFTEEMARQIVQFVEKHSDKSFIVHCNAGMSRSAAVAEFVHVKLGHELIGIEINHTNFANPLVKRLLFRALWE